MCVGRKLTGKCLCQHHLARSDIVEHFGRSARRRLYAYGAEEICSGPEKLAGDSDGVVAVAICIGCVELRTAHVAIGSRSSGSLHTVECPYLAEQGMD